MKKHGGHDKIHNLDQWCILNLDKPEGREYIVTKKGAGTFYFLKEAESVDAKIGNDNREKN